MFICQNQDSIIRLARYIASIGVNFLNLIEFLFTEANWERCSARGYLQKDSNSSAVKGSEHSAYKILSELSKDDELKLNIHYCSEQFIYGHQLPNRLLLRAKNVIRPLEILTDDVTFLFGIIEPSSDISLKRLKMMLDPLIKKHGVSDDLIILNKKRQRIEIASSVLQRFASELPKDIRKKCFIIEQFPTADHLEARRISLDEFVEQAPTDKF